MAEDDHGNLEPPPRTSIDDPGARELESSDSSDDHFSDAQSGIDPSTTVSPTVPTTRIEKVDDEPSYGEVPGTDAYKMRAEDAEPDVVAMAPEFHNPTRARRPSTPGDLPIPTTVVEKIDPDTPSHGEVPGTPAHEKRKADAVPDLVLKTTPGRSRSDTTNTTRSRAGSTPGDLPIPKVKVEKIDATPSHGEVPGTLAYEMRKEDAEPDELVVSDTSG
ncbi:Phospholipase D nuclease protein [Rutstroemia sp. NJR-2017a WRK4]|nr:Phospholipase D nuclease protein [Rutstroemia sp. NJR-2017a WRK4]